MEPIEASAPLELVHLDFVNIELGPDKYYKVLVITDHLTGYAQAYPAPNETARTTARLFVEEFCTVFGLPQRIITDQGKNFTSDLMKEVCRVLGIEKCRTTPYHPQTNGQCERFNRTLISMLGTLDHEQKSKWPKLIKRLVLCYNSTRSRVTGYTPSHLMFGFSPRLPLDVEMGLPGPGGWINHGKLTKYVARLKKHLEWGYKAAKKLRAREAKRNKNRYDEKIRGATLEVGDIVLVRRKQFPGKHKIADKWMEGHYIVRARHANNLVFEVQDLDGGEVKTLHRNMLLPVSTPIQIGKDVEAEVDIENDDEGTCDENDDVSHGADEPAQPPIERKRPGRPKGSKNKVVERVGEPRRSKRIAEKFH